MKQISRRLRYGRRFACLALALAMLATFMPPALAEEGDAQAAGTPAVDGSAFELPEEIEIDLGADAAGDEDLAPPLDAGVAAPQEAEAAAPEPGLASNGSGHGAAFSKMLASLGHGSGPARNATVSHSVKITQSGSTVTIAGSVPSPYQLGGIIVDESWESQQMFGSSINQTLNMNSGKYATGYHTVVVGIYRQTEGGPEYADLIMQKYVVANLISDRPTYKGVFEVNHRDLDIYPYNMALENQRGNLYLEYSADGGKTWTRSGYMRANMIKLYIQQGYTISGLKANTTYRTRLRYGQDATYSTRYEGDGKTYVFLGPALNTATVKTGAGTKPAIKSVTAKATGVRFHKNRVAGHYEWAGTSLIWIGPFTEKFYTCKIKVTVKLKKKPGTNGLWISCAGQDKWVKGNKKTYSATFTPYPNYFAKKPKGHYRYTVTVRSGQSKTWGGYSPAWSRSKKLS